MITASKPVYGEGQKSAHEGEALVRRLYECFDNGRLEELGDAIAPDFVARVMGTTTLDWDGFRDFGDAFRTAFPDGRHVFEYFMADNGNVVTIGTYEGTHLGNMQGIAPTKRRLGLSVMHLDRVVNGKLIEHRGLANEVDFMRQLGIELKPDPVGA